VPRQAAPPGFETDVTHDASGNSASGKTASPGGLGTPVDVSGFRGGYQPVQRNVAGRRFDLLLGTIVVVGDTASAGVTTEEAVLQSAYSRTECVGARNGLVTSICAQRGAT